MYVKVNFTYASKLEARGGDIDEIRFTFSGMAFKNDRFDLTHHIGIK